MCCQLTTQAQRPGPRNAPIATWTRWPGSLQRMVRPHRHKVTNQQCQILQDGCEPVRRGGNYRCEWPRHHVNVPRQCQPPIAAPVAHKPPDEMRDAVAEIVNDCRSRCVCKLAELS